MNHLDNYNEMELQSKFVKYCIAGDIVNVTELISKLRDLNAEDFNRNTAIHMAAKSNRLNIIKLLVENGADVNVSTSAGVTAIITAANRNYLNIVEYLVENGADTNLSTREGRTALIFAISGHNLEVVEYLVSVGADVNNVTNSGWTALMHAASSNYLNIVKCLVKYGADVNTKSTDNHKTTAFRLSMYNATDGVFRYLLAHPDNEREFNELLTGDVIDDVLNRDMFNKKLTVVKEFKSILDSMSNGDTLSFEERLDITRML